MNAITMRTGSSRRNAALLLFSGGVPAGSVGQVDCRPGSVLAVSLIEPVEAAAIRRVPPTRCRFRQVPRRTLPPPRAQARLLPATLASRPLRVRRLLLVRRLLRARLQLRQQAARRRPLPAGPPPAAILGCGC